MRERVADALAIVAARRRAGRSWRACGGARSVCTATRLERAPDLLLELALVDGYSPSCLRSDGAGAAIRRLAPAEHGAGQGQRHERRAPPRRRARCSPGRAIRGAGDLGTCDIVDVVPTLLALVGLADARRARRRPRAFARSRRDAALRAGSRAAADAGAAGRTMPAAERRSRRGWRRSATWRRRADAGRARHRGSVPGVAGLAGAGRHLADGLRSRGPHGRARHLRILARGCSRAPGCGRRAGRRRAAGAARGDACGASASTWSTRTTTRPRSPGWSRRG